MSSALTVAQYNKDVEDDDAGAAGEFKHDRRSCLYRFMQASTAFAVNIFFGDIDVVGLENIPESGPIILVGNHKNQFVDAMMVVALVKARKVSFLVAEKSMHRRIIGDAARILGSIPVIRPQDRARASPGTIINFDQAQNHLIGTEDCKFFSNVKKGELISLSGQKHIAPLVIVEVLSDATLAVKPPIKSEDDPDQQGGQPAVLTIPDGGVTFKVIPKIDQSEVFNKCFEALAQGKCIGIFPEGGSSDRTDLLPLKAGVSIMAVGATARGTPVKIIPFGINYNEGHRWRSRVLVDIGKPLTVNQEIVDQYKAGSQKEAHAEFLKNVEVALRGVTFNAPDKHTLNILRTMRRLYQGTVKLPPRRFMELNRRFALAFGKFRDDDRFLDLVARVHDYMLKIRSLGIRDREVAQLPPLGSPSVSLKALASLTFLMVTTSILAISALPGLLIFLPMLLRVSYVAQQEAKRALAGSKVKVKGEDVQASQKIISTFIWTPVTIAVCTGLAVGLMIALWPKQSPYASGTIENWFFVNAVWLIPVAVFFLVPLLGFYDIFVVQHCVMQWRWIAYYKLIVASMFRGKNSSGARIRQRRKELQVRVQEVFDRVVQPTFPEWKDDIIIHREIIISHRRKSDHYHASQIAEEFKDLEMPDSPTLPNSRLTIAGLKPSMARMEEDVNRFQTDVQSLSMKPSVRRMSSGVELDVLPEDQV